MTTDHGSLSRRMMQLQHNRSSEKFHPYFQGPDMKRRTDMARKCTSSVFLPLDIIGDILSRLPAKSVARLRCVCKDWMSLTFDPYFLKAQHKLALSRPVFISLVSDINKRIKFCDFKVEDLTLIDRHVRINLEDKNRQHFGLSNSINGLVSACPRYSSFPRCYLLNPTTRESTTIQIRSQMDWILPCLGLGYDVSTGNYKLISLYHRRNMTNWSCEVLTLGTCEWRYVGEVSSEFLPQKFVPIFVYGALHWCWLIVTCRSSESNVRDFRVSMITFDIKDEKLEMTTSSVKTTIDDDIYRAAFLEWRGYLCVVLKGDRKDYLEIWMLKDHASHTWSKECSLAFPYLALSINVFALTDEKLLIVTEKGTYLHDLRGQTFHEKPGGFKIDFYPIFHRESLISPRQVLRATSSDQSLANILSRVPMITLLLLSADVFSLDG